MKPFARQPVSGAPRSSILVAEDSEDDRVLLECAFARAGVAAVLNFVSGGQEVVDYLQNVPPFEDPVRYQRPALILLDLHMPGMDGFEVLEWLRHQPRFWNIAVVVYSGSKEPSAIRRARALGARHYLVKPHSPARLVTMARSFQTFLRVVEDSPHPRTLVGC